MTEQPLIEAFEITYIRGRIERVHADYYQLNGDFVNFKREGGKTVYAIRSDAIMSCETVYKDTERVVSTLDEPPRYTN